MVLLLTMAFSMTPLSEAQVFLRQIMKKYKNSSRSMPRKSNHLREFYLQKLRP
jgi:hypothetical protein